MFKPSWVGAEEHVSFGLFAKYGLWLWAMQTGQWLTRWLDEVTGWNVSENRALRALVFAGIGALLATSCGVGEQLAKGTCCFSLIGLLLIPGMFVLGATLEPERPYGMDECPKLIKSRDEKDAEDFPTNV